MKAKSMHKKKKQTLGIDHSARRKMRAEQISNGTWMGRNAVHKSATDYNRQKEHLETKHFSYPPLNFEQARRDCEGVGLSTLH